MALLLTGYESGRVTASGELVIVLETDNGRGNGNDGGD